MTKIPIHSMTIVGGDHIGVILLGVARWMGSAIEQGEETEYKRTFKFSSYVATPASIARVLRVMNALIARKTK